MCLAQKVYVIDIAERSELMIAVVDVAVDVRKVVVA